MSWDNPLSRLLIGGVRSREVVETRRAWRDTEAMWRASPLGQSSTKDRVWAFTKEFFEAADRLPAWPICQTLMETAHAILEAEPGGEMEPLWEVVERDAAVAVSFRQMLQKRHRYAGDFDRIHGVLIRQLKSAYAAYFEALPEACFEQWPDEGAALEVPLIDLVDDPADLIERLLLVPYDDDALRLDLFAQLRERLVMNMLVASGFPPTANPHEVQNRFIRPDGQRGKSPAELADLYLGGTPFADLLNIPVPLHVPDEVRFEHAHVLGGTGHGKTQFLQRMIHADLLAARDDGRSVVVIDSQGDLISKITRLRLFDPDEPESLADRLVLIDPADVECPASLNLFDAHLDRVERYRPVDRERILNGVVELYETLFGEMLGAELTQKQGVIFRYLARLMVTIPGATIRTLMQLMEDGRPFKPQMERLEGSARYFFETEFFHPSFAATKKQILRRLWGVLSTPAFERMFAQPTNKLDLFEATRAGKIILISTAKDLLKRDGSALFGRFFVRMLAQAALERSVLPEDERTPTFVYVDEAQEYFDDGVETILQQARKYRIALVAAHQSLDQASSRLRSALFANTSFKCAGGVSSKDARALAEELRTKPEFIEGMKRRHDRTEFAAWIKNWTPSAVRLSVPLGFLERQPILSEESHDELLRRNRLQYCGTLEAFGQWSLAQASETTSAEPTHQATELLSRPLEVEAKEDMPAARTVPSVPAGERELGKGGKKHRYIQNLVKGLAEAQGFRATIEAPILGGQVDVLLEREGVAVGVEVSVTTPVEWERQNLRKCFSAGFARVALVLAKSEQTAKRYREAVVDGLEPDELSRLTILYPDNVPDFVASLIESPAAQINLVKGYRVTVSRSDVAREEAAARRDALARIVAKSLQRQGE